MSLSRREFLAAAPAIAAIPAAAQNERKPNVIWIFGDQHRAQALGCMGDPNATTPNIDNLSAMGVHFRSAVSGFPLCCPFRGSLLTGRYPHHCVPGHEYPLPDGQPTITEPLKQAGYRTAYFGKWHLAGFHESEGRAAMYITKPERRGGFDTWVGYENNNSQWDSWVHGGSGKEAFHYRLPGYETDALTDLFVRYIHDHGEEARKPEGKPFFAVLSVQPPHNPCVAPAEYMRKYNPGSIKLRANVPGVPRVVETARRELAGYYAQIENWDFNIGRIRAALQEAGLGFNTHILLFSDHGDMHGSQGQFRKMTAYEEAIRIPFVIGGEIPTYQGRLTGNVNVPANHVDIAPTTLGLCGVTKPAWMEGTDYSHFRLKGRPAQSEPDSAFLQVVVPSGHGDSVNQPWRGLVTREGWKYTCFDGISWLMFNLNDDPYEQANLAYNNRFRPERRKLIARLKQWVSDTGDQFRIPED